MHAQWYFIGRYKEEAVRIAIVLKESINYPYSSMI